MYSIEEARVMRQNFWKAFADYTQFYSRKIGEPVSWMLYNTGIKGVELKFAVEKKYQAVILEVNVKNENKRFDIFLLLDQYKVVLEEGLEDVLIWEDNVLLNENKYVSRVLIELEGINYHNEDNWPDIFRFMAENMYKLQQNFLDIHPILEDRFK